jgi:hypothetical protein
MRYMPFSVTLTMKKNPDLLVAQLPGSIEIINKKRGGRKSAPHSAFKYSIVELFPSNLWLDPR